MSVSRECIAMGVRVALDQMACPLFLQQGALHWGGKKDGKTYIIHA